MEERRKTLRRVTPDRRKGERRVKQIPVQVQKRVTGERRKGERRVLAGRRKNKVILKGDGKWTIKTPDDARKELSTYLPPSEL